MPSATIEVRRSYTPEEEVGIIEAVHGAMKEVLRLPPHDRNVRLFVHEPHRFAYPPNRDQPEFCTHISIDAFSGRSLDVKRALYAEIVNRLEGVGIPRDHVTILVRELPQENWGVRGGQAACDIDLVSR